MNNSPVKSELYVALENGRINLLLTSYKKFNLENNTITWCNGEIDFAPDTIYENGVTVKL